MPQKLKDRLKEYFHKVSRENSSEHSIALGFAIGTFINIVFPGISIFIALIIVLLYRSLNKLSLFVALALWNPVTLIPLYLASYQLGHLLFGPLPPLNYDLFTVGNFYALSKNFLLGNIIVGTIISVANYFIVKQIVLAYRRRRNRNSSSRP
jgi:uncharacterized protein (DUF2062 family)